MRLHGQRSRTSLFPQAVPLTAQPVMGARLGSQATQSSGGRDPGAPAPPPPARGEAAPPPKDDDDSDDDGLGGVIVDDAPVVPDGRDPRRGSRPDDDAKHKLGLAHIHYRLDR
eukprot:2964387-Pyramimonas_sp.AAC.1